MFIPCSPTKSNNMSAQKTNSLKNFKYICTYLEEDKITADMKTLFSSSYWFNLMETVPDDMNLCTLTNVGTDV